MFNCEQLFQVNVSTSTINSYQLFFNCEQLFQLNVSTSTINYHQLFLPQRFNSKFILHIVTVNNLQQINENKHLVTV